MYRYLGEVSRDINVVEELGAEARCIYVRALEDSVIGLGSAGDLIPLKKDEELLIFFPQGIDVVRVASGRVEMILATSSREAVVGFLRLRSVRDILSRLRNLSFEDGRLLVKALVENPELIVALSAENDSVLAYGKDYDNDVVRPIAVDEGGQVVVSQPIDAVVVSEPAYDPGTDLKKVSIERDNVGLLKEGGRVNVANFPSVYPLPDTQVRIIKNKVRVMAWNPTTSAYELIEGYEGSKSFTYDSSGNLTEVRMTIILDDGSTRTVKRTFAYDANGNLTQVSRWEVVG